MRVGRLSRFPSSNRSSAVACFAALAYADACCGEGAMTRTGVRTGAGGWGGANAWLEAHPMTPRMIDNGTRLGSHPPLRRFPTKFRQLCIMYPLEFLFRKLYGFSAIFIKKSH